MEIIVAVLCGMKGVRVAKRLPRIEMGYRKKRQTLSIGLRRNWSLGRGRVPSLAH